MSSILVITDLSDKHSVAVRQAARLAKALHAPLHVAYFCFANLREATGDVEDLKAVILQRAEQQAREHLESTLGSEVSYSHEVVWDKRIEGWARDYVVGHHPVAVVKSVHCEEKPHYTPADWYLLRECQTPVLVVSEEHWRDSNHILAAVDLGTKRQDKQLLNDSILSRAIQLARSASDIYVCYSPPVSQLLRDLGIQFRDEIELHAKADLKERVAELSAKYQIPKDNFIIQAGEPERVLSSNAARLKANMVVIGTVARAGLSGTLIGNTAEKILIYLKTDVLALKA